MTKKKTNHIGTEVSIKDEDNQLVVHTKEQLRAKMKVVLVEIDKKLAKLQPGNGCYKASAGTANFRLSALDSLINIQSYHELGYLIRSIAHLKKLKAEYEETAKSLGLTSYPVCLFLFQNVDNWLNDLELRIAILSNANQITSLKAQKAKLETFLSEEDRLATTLEEISKLL